MSTTCVVGILWGDEGKGKVIDFLAADADFVVRYGGGHNAGHTLILPSGKMVLHLVPSGIVHERVTNVIGNGVVVDPLHLVKEIDGVRARGIRIALGENLLISERAHVILEAHRVQDQWHEQARGKGRIGTTGRGIGPAYADRCNRIGLRMGDLIRPDALRAGIERLCSEKNPLFAGAGLPELSPSALFEQLAAAGEQLRQGIVDAGHLLRVAHKANKRILLEGAQGCLLDVEHGTYPYVTSSHASTGGAFSGTGLPPHGMRTVGIVKAYATRVGEGPFPSELQGELAEQLRKAGNEYGSTTGRPRRIGWFDAVAVRYSADLSGAQELVVTNLDVLSGFDAFELVTHYRLADGTTTDRFVAFGLEGATPITQHFAGFSQNLRECRRFEDLPAQARDYVLAIERATGVPVKTISVGPGRDQVILR
jgi:adenylosuccinate synthase